jgi:hypothetical protein
MKKMKNILVRLICLLFLFNLIGCTDYLEIVPDERPTEADSFRTPNAALGFLYSCYSYLPNSRNVDNSIDFMTSDEVVTSFEHKTFAKFPRGEYTASNPVISYWNDLYKGIRQCYIFINNIDGVDGVEQDTKDEYKAEANFLIGYYHFLLIRMYGPVVIADQEFDINITPDQYPVRATYDESVNFIANKLDEAALGLPATQTSTINYGRATSVIAKAIKSRLLLYAASPLFNGGGSDKQSLFSNFKNAEGEELIPTGYDNEKWTRAANASKDAIDAAEAAGFQLYENSDYDSELPADPTEKDLRYVFIDKSNKEVIWAMTRREGNYEYQNNVTPFLTGNDGVAYNGVGPTLSFLETFYSANGLPIDKDPDYEYQGRYDIDSTDMGNTLALNLNREPRFDAWISYHNDYYEIIRGDKKEIVTKYRRDDPQGIRGRSNNYSPTGYLVKKGVAPLLNQSRLQISVNYPWPLIRLAELYLNYGEALIGSGQDLNTAKQYIDKVRLRAGIPTIDQSWAPIGGANDQETLTSIVRQERSIELFLENQRFWDLRRWQIADQHLNSKLKGMNIQGVTDEEFFQIKEVQFPRTFNQRNYLMPIPQPEINKNELLIQNPGY